jgi:hypothetical protein
LIIYSWWSQKKILEGLNPEKPFITYDFLISIGVSKFSGRGSKVSRGDSAPSRHYNI